MIAVGAFVQLAWGAPAPALHVQHSEGLSRAKLPHGIVALPVRGSARARHAGGYIFRFNDASLHVSPLDAQDRGRPNFAAIREAILKEKTGDLCYVPAPDESLLAWSGRIAEVGPGFLFELSGKQLPRPAGVLAKRERDSAAGRGYPGRLGRVRLDGRYLAETVDGRYALFRVIEKAPTFVVIQWVYQPSGARVFGIPKWRLVEHKPMATPAERIGYRPARPPERAPQPPPPPDAPQIVNVEDFPAGTTRHLANRKVLIRRLMEILENRDDRAGHTARGIAADALGRMRAVEAAPLLASLIDELLPFPGDGKRRVRPSPVRNMYGAVPALVRVGRPGAAACLDAITRLTRGERTETSKLRLLATVVFRVEGKEVATLLVRDRMAKAQAREERDNLKHTLELLQTMR